MRNKYGRHAFITGVTGQDGSYLAELLLNKGYRVFGLVRRTSNYNFKRIEHIRNDITIINGDILDFNSVKTAIKISRPHEIYHLAAQSHVGDSFGQPDYTFESIVKGTLNVLEIAKESGSKLYQASSSEMFGDGDNLNELSPFNPVSPYGIAKLAAHRLCQIYRKAYHVKVSCGILFNHESPRRGEHFVTRKITKAIATETPLHLYNIKAIRDWGHAQDYVKAMWTMLQSKPDDYVIATGIGRSIEDFIHEASKSKVPVSFKIDDSFKRPIDIDVLVGDPSKAKRVLGWKHEITFEQLVKEMIDADIHSEL